MSTMPRLIQLQAGNYHTLPPHLLWFFSSGPSRGCLCFQLSFTSCAFCLHMPKFTRSNNAVGVTSNLLDLFSFILQFWGKSYLWLTLVKNKYALRLVLWFFSFLVIMMHLAAPKLKKSMAYTIKHYLYNVPCLGSMKWKKTTQLTSLCIQNPLFLSPYSMWTFDHALFSKLCITQHRSTHWIFSLLDLSA